MKTTLEIPDDVYREVKTLAARQNLKMKDLFTRGLRKILDEESSRTIYPTPLETLSMVREAPLHSTEEIKTLIDQMDRDRKTGWTSSGDAAG